MSKPTEESKSLKVYVNNISKIIASILILLFAIILFVIICVPIYLYRLIVYGIFRLFRKDLVRMLSSQSSIMATDSMYTEPQCAFVTKLVLDGEISRELLESRLKTAIGHTKFGGLSQTLETWLGFFFWKDHGEHLLLENHLEFHEETVTIDEIAELHSSLVDKSFNENQPLWECIVYTNVLPQTVIKNVTRQSVIFFRIHQALMDGTQFFNIFDELNMIPENQAMTKTLVARSSKISLFKKVKLGLRVLVLGPYNLVKEWVDQKTSSLKLQKSCKLSKLEFSQNRYYTIEERCLEDAKRIASTTFAPTGALVISLIAGAMRRFYVNENTEEKELSVENNNGPQTVKLNIQVPIPFDTDKLDNHVAFIPVNIPIDKNNADPMLRLGSLLPLFANLFFSTTPYISFGLIVLVGSLPSGLIPWFSRRLPLGSVIVNNYPGSNAKRKFLDQDVAAITVKSGCPSVLGGAWCIINSINYKGEVTISVTYPKELDVGDKISKEFEICSNKPKGNNLNNLFNMMSSGNMDNLLKQFSSVMSKPKK